jgi:hypothetical protein
MMRTGPSLCSGWTVDDVLAHLSGPVVEGPVLSLLLAATGRRAALEDLSGPGLDLLRSRSQRRRQPGRGQPGQAVARR